MEPATQSQFGEHVLKFQLALELCIKKIIIHFKISFALKRNKSIKKN